jgi:hypothetical protein
VGISILEPPLSRSILLCDRARYLIAGERVLRRLAIEDEAEAVDSKLAEAAPNAGDLESPT